MLRTMTVTHTHKNTQTGIMRYGLMITLEINRGIAVMHLTQTNVHRVQGPSQVIGDVRKGIRS